METTFDVRPFSIASVTFFVPGYDNSRRQENDVSSKGLRPIFDTV